MIELVWTVPRRAALAPPAPRNIDVSSREASRSKTPIRSPPSRLDDDVEHAGIRSAVVVVADTSSAARMSRCRRLCAPRTILALMRLMRTTREEQLMGRKFASILAYLLGDALQPLELGLRWGSQCRYSKFLSAWLC